MKQQSNGTVQYDKFLLPQNTLISAGTMVVKQVAWQFGVKQDIQSKQVRASTGAFKNLTGTLTANSIMGGTINTSLFQNGTVANNVISGATISQPSVTGGTFTNPTINTGTINTSLMTGTLNSGVLGTPQITGGTLGTVLATGGTANFGTYQTGGTGGVSGSIVYIKTVSPGTTFGTVSFTNGLITAFN